MNNIIQSPIVEEVEQSFLDYSLSVITDRAIPAVEDGVKPVVRRILWDMLDKGLRSDKKYVKCATPVGDTMSRFHPHGDSSIYGALVGLSQPWNMRYPLIDFHGNNGSRDGDGPAAYRYTECKLSKIAEATMANIKKDTVDWVPNFSEEETEPVYLPGVFPNLLCNGTTGIAVAMACNFAPHNLGEVMDAIIYYLKNRTCKGEDLLQFIKGPDFPTGGLIINQKELRTAYLTGKGRVRLRGKYTIEKSKGYETLVFTEIPYKVSKEKLITDIDALCEEGKLSGINEIRDESNKQGVRFVLELAKGTNADVVANQLFALTDLETTFSINQVALVNKTPRQLTLLDIVKYYYKHQEEVIRRLKSYEYKELSDRVHILEGLSKALEDIDNVIHIIKKSQDKNDARANLMKKYDFSEAQANAILGMTLSKLSNMESIAIEKELAQKDAERSFVFTILNNDEVFLQYMEKYLTDFKNTFSDARRTEITHIEITKEEKEVIEIVPEDVIVVLTEAGNIKRIPTKSFRTQNRNGKGIKSQDDVTKATISTNTVDILLVFTNVGRVYRLGVDLIPEGTSSSRGTAINTLLDMIPAEKVAAITSMTRNTEDKYVWFVTQKGLIKKTNLSEYNGTKRKTGITALGLREGDSLVSVWIGNNSDILILTQKGQGIRFDGTDVGATGRTASGVCGIRLNSDDSVACGCCCRGSDPNERIFIFYSTGDGKLVYLREFSRQGRGGKGVRVAGSVSIVSAIGCLSDSDNIFISGDKSSICLSVKDISAGSRTSSPVKLIKDNRIVSVARV